MVIIGRRAVTAWMGIESFQRAVGPTQLVSFYTTNLAAAELVSAGAL